MVISQAATQNTKIPGNDSCRTKAMRIVAAGYKNVSRNEIPSATRSHVSNFVANRMVVTRYRSDVRVSMGPASPCPSLFVTQCFHGVNAHSSLRRHIARQQRGCDQDGGHRDEREWVEDAYAEEEVSDHPAEGERCRQADHCSDTGEAHALPY